MRNIEVSDQKDFAISEHPCEVLIVKPITKKGLKKAISTNIMLAAVIMAFIFDVMEVEMKRLDEGHRENDRR